MGTQLPIVAPGSAARASVVADDATSAASRIYLHQFNQAYDNNIYLPLSIAMLKASCDADPFIRQHYTFAEMIFAREPLDSIIGRYEDPEILGFSLYVWNTQISLKLAERMKRRRNSLIIFGGPSVENDSERMLGKYPFIDYLVHGEGERTFVELLHALKEKRNLLDVQGLSFLHDGAYYKTPDRKRTQDLDQVPSPFLEGTFDEVLKEPYQFQAIWETNRGCPFQCTFCYWGSNLRAKISKMSMDRLRRELEWMAEHKIEHIYAADANFGIIERDEQIAEMIIDLSQRRGYPKSFFINYSKNTGDRVFNIARRFSEAGISKGTTLSLQSLDDNVLEYIKRKNIKMSVFKELQRKYKAAGVPSYTELILPLPGESLATFTEGLEETFRFGEHDQVYIHLCRLLPNTEMACSEARAQFGMQSRMIPILSAHASLDQDENIETEYEEILLGTNTMPVNDWKLAVALSNTVTVHLCLKASYFISLYLHHEHDIPFMTYCRHMIDQSARHADRFPLLHAEYNRLMAYIDDLLEGRDNIQYDGLPAEVPDIRWPVEEVTFMRLAFNRAQAYREIRGVTDRLLEDQGIEVEGQLLDELFDYQQRRLVDVHLQQPKRTYSWNFPAFFEAVMIGTPTELRKELCQSTLQEPHSFADVAEFAKYQVWFGRRGKKFYYPETYRSPASQEAQKASINVNSDLVECRF